MRRVGHIVANMVGIPPHAQMLKCFLNILGVKIIFSLKKKKKHTETVSEKYAITIILKCEGERCQLRINQHKASLIELKST